MTAQSDVQGPWLDGTAVARASDVVLGGVAAVLGAAVVATAYGSGPPFSGLDREATWFFSAIIGALLVLAGVALLLRGSLLRPRTGAPRSLTGFAIVVALILVAGLCAWQWGSHLALLLGPPEYVGLIALVLATAIAIARLSWLRAVAMALIGFLLAIVGLDLETGVPRLTMGLADLLDGIPGPVLALGLLVVADAAVCLFSPNLFLATYGRHMRGWASPSVGSDGRLAMRILAPWAIAGAGLLAYRLNNSAWDVGLLVLFGAFGVACKLLGWNRVVPLLAFAYGPLLEQNIRQAMVIARGDPAILVRNPVSAGLLLLAFAVLAVPALLSLRRALSRGAGA